MGFKARIIELRNNMTEQRELGLQTDSKVDFHHTAQEFRAAARRIAHKRGERISVVDKRFPDEWRTMVRRSAHGKRMIPDQADTSGLLKEAAFASRQSLDRAISLAEMAQSLDEQRAKSLVAERTDYEHLLNPFIPFVLYKLYEDKFRGRRINPTPQPRLEAMPLRLNSQS